MARISREAPDGYKWCPRCQDYRPRNEFGQNTSTHDGLQHYCRVHQNFASSESRKQARDYRLSRLLGSLKR